MGRTRRDDDLAQHFTDEQILDIIGINMNVWTRLELAEGATLGLVDGSDA